MIATPARQPVDRVARIQALCCEPSIQKLDALLREQAGVGLIVLLPQEYKKLEVCSAGGPAILPEFCRLIHGAPGGIERCITCRSNLAFAAYNRGLVRHECHGGVSVFAAPVNFEGAGTRDIVVVSSCAFTPKERATGWKLARKHAKGLALDTHALRNAYYHLPSLSGSKTALVRSIVDLAARILAEKMKASASTPAAGDSKPQSRMEASIRDALALSPDRMFQGLDRPSGAALIEVVAAVARNNPGLPFRVTEIARSARISPNHFSMLFRKHMGQSFSTFLLWMRIARAQELLRDLKLSIQEVALQSGFDDANYFARRFRDKIGASPRTWRAAL
jgi:AraC-like DNA-binding protein